MLKLFCGLLLASLIFSNIGICQSGQLPPDISKDFKYTPPTKPLVGRLAFTAKIGNWQRIFSLDLKTGNIMPIIVGPGNNFYPSWSPDGTSITFVSDRDGNNEIYSASWYGEKAQRLTINNLDDNSPDWGPGPHTITFSSISGATTKIIQLDTLSAEQKTITSYNGRDTTPRMSPDGKILAYSTNRFWPGWDICLFDLANKNEQCVFKGSTSHCRPFWSKDSKRLLHAMGDGKDINIALHDLKIDLSERISTMSMREYDPIWGPDEQSVIFVAETGKIDHFDIYIKFNTEKEPHLLLTSPYSIRFLSLSNRTTLQLEAQRIREQSLTTIPKN